MLWKQCRADCLEDFTGMSQYECAQHVGYAMDCARLQSKWEMKRCDDEDRKDKARCVKLETKFSDTGCPKQAEGGAEDEAAADDAADAAADDGAPKVCPSDYTEASGYCFALKGERGPWKENVCGDAGRLAVVDSMEFAKILRINLEVNTFWVGGKSKDGKMKWIDGQLMSATDSGLFEGHAMDLADAASRDYCAVYSSGSGQMNFEKCDGSNFRFTSICQVDIN